MNKQVKEERDVKRSMNTEKAKVTSSKGQVRFSHTGLAEFGKPNSHRSRGRYGGRGLGDTGGGCDPWHFCRRLGGSLH